MATKKTDTNQGYQGRIARWDFSVGLLIDRPSGHRFTLADERHRSATIFRIAADLEIKAAELGRVWPVSPSAMDGRIKIECEDYERDEAIELLAAAATAHNVTVVVR